MNMNVIHTYDKIILAIAVFMLLFGTCSFKKYEVENFVELTHISTEEDTTEITQNLSTYLTVFNINSFDNGSSVWNNLASVTSNGTPGCKTDFSFELQPTYNRRSGLFLGNNRIVGPHSNNLDIMFNNTYTIILACKHGNLLIDDKNNDLELIKLYANSPNNNGLSLFIKNDSLNNTNNVQTGNLLFQYANNGPIECKIDKTHSNISLDKDVLSFYYIIKDTDNVRVLFMNEKSNVINQVLKFNITNTDITFSNKELVINRLMNWNGNMFTFAIYKQAFNDDQVSKFYTHVMNEYLKNIDPNFTGIMDKYNKAVTLLQNESKCPYDKPTCDKCSTVTQWNNIDQILTSSAECKKSMNDFCDLNRSHVSCKCWDQTSPTYNSEMCRIFRSLFSGDKHSLFEGLTSGEIEIIMKKYGLIYPNQCPVTVKEPERVESKYEFDKLKVSLDPVEKIEEHEPEKPSPPPQSAVSDKLQSNPSMMEKFMKMINPF